MKNPVQHTFTSLHWDIAGFLSDYIHILINYDPFVSNIFSAFLHWIFKFHPAQVNTWDAQIMKYKYLNSVVQFFVLLSLDDEIIHHQGMG